MAAETTEEQRKAILPFLQRAEEIDRVEPKMAYYCRMHAVEQGLALANRSAQIDGLLGALLSKLEKDKPALKLGNPADDAGECETFALRVFARADKADRAGRADKGTATAFYAASVFMEVLNQFGPLSSDIAEAQRYAAWKAADIRKALREGRTPLPGPPATWGSGGGGNGGGVAGPADAMPTLSTPPTGPPGLDRSDSALGTGPGGDLLITLAPPRFAPGDAVFYCPDGHGPPTRGVVTGGPFPPEGLGHTYALALATGGGDGVGATGTSPGQAVRAFEVQLAPDVGAGAAARLGPPPPPPGPEGSSSPPPKDVPPAGACVVEALVDPSAWRPAYRVKMEGAKKAVVVSDTRLAGWPRGGPGAGGGVPPPATSSSPPPPFAAPHAPPAAAAATPSAPPIPPPPSSTTAPPAVPSLAVLAEAQKAARSAASSIAFEDVGTAVRFLQEALRLLTVDGASVSNSKKK